MPIALDSDQFIVHEFGIVNIPVKNPPAKGVSQHQTKIAKTQVTKTNPTEPRKKSTASSTGVYKNTIETLG